MLDIKTIALMIAFGNLTFGLLASIYNITNEVKNSALQLYQWGKFAGGFGLLLLALHQLVIPIVALDISHILLFSGWCLEFGAYCLFLKRTKWLRFIFYLWLFSIIFLQITYLTDHDNMNLLNSLVGGIVFSSMSFCFFSCRNRSWLLHFLAVIDLISATLFFARTAERILLAVHITTMSHTVANTLLYIDGFFAMICHGFGFLLLVKQEDEKRLKHAFTELEKAEADQRQMLSMATHEFRTPLSVIDSTVQLLCVTMNPDAQTQKLLDRIRRGVKRLVHFLDNCLTEDRLDNRALILHADKVDLNQLAAWGLENAELISSAHKIRLDLAPRLPLIEGDKHLLKVLLINLLSNAIKFSKPEAEIVLRIHTVNEKIVLAVCDAGQGIPADELPHVSEKYMRGRGAGTISGAGLGLSLVVRIVELHHGHFSISSTLGKGTTVKIELPLKLPLKPEAE